MRTYRRQAFRFLGFCVIVAGYSGPDVNTWGVPPDGLGPRRRPLWIAATETSSRVDDVLRGTLRATAVASVQARAVGGDNCNEATISPVAVPGSLTIFGDSTGATGPDLCFSKTLTLWWEAFEITQCADVTLDFCGTDPRLLPAFAILVSHCAPDGSTCGRPITQDAVETSTCVDSNVTMTFEGLPPGVYYYPIISDSPGPYQMNINTTTCVGACCNTSTRVCEELVLETNCRGADQRFLAGAECCEVECRDPAGPEFEASGVELLSRVSLEDVATFNGTPDDPHTGGVVWGYTSPSGRQYAIMATTTGTGFVDVTDPRSPVILAFINNGGVDQIWRDIATFGEYAYVVTDGVGVGLQIIDLSDIDAGNVTFVKSTDLGLGLSEVHNIDVNPDSGFLYLCIPNIDGGLGLTAVSLADPVNPVRAGIWMDTVPGVRCHNARVVTYTSGPNAGREIAFCFANEDGLKIADVTNKASMFTVSTLDYPTRSLCHQGWMSEDLQFVVFDDELDELNGLVDRTTTYVADVSDLNTPTLAGTFEHEGCNIDHNLMVRGDFVYEANYATGLRVLSFASPPNLTAFGFFDTHPEDDATEFDGASGVFADYPTRIVTLSDRQRGLFVLCAEPGKPIPGFVLDRNPATENAAVGFDAASSTTCDPARSLVNYEWDFDYDGVIFDVDATGSTSTHTYAATGDYAVALRVTDNQGTTGITTLGITVQRAIPTISQWGLVSMALLMLAAGTIAIKGRRSLGHDL